MKSNPKVVYSRKDRGYKIVWRDKEGWRQESIETYAYKVGAEESLKPYNQQEKSHWEDSSFI